MGLVDSHAHLTFPELIDQIEEVLARARSAGVDQIITVGTNPVDVCKAVELADRFPDCIRAAVGFHPHGAKDVTAADLKTLDGLVDYQAVVALGEIGLDYHYDFSPRSVQLDVFDKQLQIASRCELPLVIHSREAVDETVRALETSGFAGRRVVFHCFTGTAEEAASIAEHGWRISFTGVVTFKGSRWLQAIARDYPADRLMVETDCPYLSPVPVRGKHPNEPAHIAHTVRFLADLRGVSYETLAEQTAQNTRDFFGL